MCSLLIVELEFVEKVKVEMDATVYFSLAQRANVTIFFRVEVGCFVAAVGTCKIRHFNPLGCKILDIRGFNRVLVKPGEPGRIAVHNPHYRQLCNTYAL